jgi:hypothetical protein
MLHPLSDDTRMTTPRPASRLDDLAARALLGVERGAAGPEAADAAAQLLRSAAVAALEGRAGRRPERVTALPEPCPEETWPRASGAAQARLEQLLDSGNGELALEWLLHASGRRLRVAEALVPRVLERYEKGTGVPAEVLPALGVHGPWLARWNPTWRRVFRQGADISDLDERWATERAAERAALLASVRRSDRARGRALVEGIWASERAEERVSLLEALRPAIGPDDEPMLERALDDRAKSVRGAAAELLALLPTSAFKRRMNERMAAMVRVTRERSGIFRREKLTVDLDPPTELDPTWARDGVDADPPKHVGPRAWWFMQVVGFADPDVVTRMTGLGPEAFVEAIQASDFADECIAGLAHAARAHAALEWAIVVSAVALARAAAARPLHHLGDVGRYWESLPRSVLEPLSVQALRTDQWRAAILHSTFASLPRFWAPEFSRAMVASLTALPAPSTAKWYSMPVALQRMSLCLHPEALGGLERWISTLQPAGQYATMVQKAIDDLLSLVRFRHELYKEFLS